MKLLDYEIFKKEIYSILNIDLNYYKERQMKRRIDSLISKNAYNGYEEYLLSLKTDRILLNEFVNYLTINVSEFYRNAEQWSVLEKDILPMLLNRKSCIKIWSCACSTGDEPYTTAMIIDRMASLSRVKIIASDIDKAALNKAKIGIYNYKSLEKLPESIVKNYFINMGSGKYQIIERIKQGIEFKKLNLLEDPYPEKCDLIICRNVLIYFTQQAKDMIYNKFSGVLNEDGVLFVGNTEQIITPNKYRLKPLKTFFYANE